MCVGLRSSPVKAKGAEPRSRSSGSADRNRRWRLWTWAIADTEWKGLHPHAFRHGRVTDLVSRRAFEPAIKRRAGWTKGSAMIFRYTHIKDRDLDDSIGEALGVKTLPEPAPVARIDAIASGEAEAEALESKLMEISRILVGASPEYRKALAEVLLAAK